MKRNIAVIFGGRTVEHDVSIISGHQLMENADKHLYEVYPIYISSEGDWFTGDALWDVSFYKRFDPHEKSLKRVYISPVANSYELMAAEGARFSGPKPICKLDVVIPAIHGMHGEDGTLQGLLELANIPYSSSGVLGSSVGMDKIVRKSVFKGCGFPVLDSLSFTRDEWNSGSEALIGRMEGNLTYPMFVKPANLGSSIGISKAKDRDSLREAIEIATEYDRRILVENGVDRPMEINCSCIGFGDEVTPSLLEQPVFWEDFLTYEDKYLKEGKGKGKGMQSMDRRIPAPVSDELTARVRALATEVFKALDCKGVVRIDFILDGEENLYVNEINTVPGSFAFYLWEPVGITFPKLIDMLVDYALKAHAEKNANEYAFDSNVLNKLASGGKGGIKNL